MILGGLQPCSTIDYPRALACVLFTRGCNYNCFYCHNRDLISKDGRRTDLEGVIDFLNSRKSLLDAVVLSGGEPTLQPDIADFLAELKSMDYRTKLDTNGSNPDIVLSLVDAGLLNYVAVDFKAPEKDYSWACGDPDGFNNARSLILELSKRKINFEARCTVYPGFTADALSELLGSVPPLRLFKLNAFRMPEVYDPSHTFLLRRPVLSKEKLKALIKELQRVQPNVKC